MRTTEGNEENPYRNEPPVTNWAPETKVASGGLAGAVGLILIGLIEYAHQVDIPSPYEAAIYTLVFFVIQYLVPNRDGSV